MKRQMLCLVILKIITHYEGYEDSDEGKTSDFGVAFGTSQLSSQLFCGEAVGVR